MTSSQNPQFLVDLTVWKNHMSAGVTEPIRIVFAIPIHIYTYLDLKREVKIIIKGYLRPGLQKQSTEMLDYCNISEK